MRRYHNVPNAPPPPAGRQPLLWAAFSFSAGIVAGSYLWRPPYLWLLAEFVFAVATGYFLRHRTRTAFAFALSCLFVAGAFRVQMSPPAEPIQDIVALTAGEDVPVIAHVVRDGRILPSPAGERQSLDIETEQLSLEGRLVPLRCGVRLGLYGGTENATDNSASRAFHYGERLRVTARFSAPHNFRNPGAFDYRAYLAQKGITALASAKTTEVEVLPGFSGNRLELLRTGVHRSIVEKIHALWPEREAALMDAMVIGEDAFLTREIRTGFQRSGTYHVLVVSGMNVGILALVVFWLFRRLRISEVFAGLLTVVLCVAYAFVTDVGPPVWRATLMLAIYLGARALYRERSALNALGAAALGLLVIDPNALFGASFQLTFACVLLIAAAGVPLLERTTQPYVRALRNLHDSRYDFAIAPKAQQFRLDLRLIAGRLDRIVRRKFALKLLAFSMRLALSACEILLISAVMQAGLALPMAYYFHRATVIGLPANLLVVPLSEALLPMAALAVAVGYVSPALAKFPALISGFTLEAVAGSVRWLGAFRVADIRVAAPGTAVILLCSLACIAAMVAARRRAIWFGVSLAALAFSALWIGTVPPRPHTLPGQLELTAIDVGQGDSLLVVSPQGRTLLIDAGGLPAWMHSSFDTGESVVSPYLWWRGISRLDAVAVTHAHADHIGGMHSVLANFRPHEMWIGLGPPNPELASLLQEARELGIRVIQRREGDAFAWGGAQVRVLAPDSTAEADESQRRRNDESLVLKLVYGKTSMLLEGDAEKRAEREIAAEDPEADVLKVAHHGSATSTIPELLAAVHPRFAVISVGARNTYRHPRPEVLERLEESGVRTFRTDLDGAVTFYLDGDHVSPRPAVP